MMLNRHTNKIKDHKTTSKNRKKSSHILRFVTKTIGKIISTVSTFVWEDSIPSLISQY